LSRQPVTGALDHGALASLPGSASLACSIPVIEDRRRPGGDRSERGERPRMHRSSQAANRPPVGMAFWLLSDGSGADRVAWLSRQGFQALSLLVKSPDPDDPERRDTACAIRDAGLVTSCHPGYQAAVGADGRLDRDLVRRLHDQVLWWHAHAGGVRSACADPIHVKAADGETTFSTALNLEAMALAAEALAPAGIRFGWENTFGPPGCCQSVADINRFAAACARPGLGLLLDLGHLNIHLHSPAAGTKDPEIFIRQLAVEIHEVHITDNLGQRDEHRHLGYGNLDLGAAMRGLRAVGFRGPLVVEVCSDILSGRYQSRINDPAQVAPLLATRDRLAEAVRRFFP
jgi:sugar phosphate isomerase/epimerase